MSTVILDIVKDKLELTCCFCVIVPSSGCPSAISCSAKELTSATLSSWFWRSCRKLRQYLNKIKTKNYKEITDVYGLIIDCNIYNVPRAMTQIKFEQSRQNNVLHDLLPGIFHSTLLCPYCWYIYLYLKNMWGNTLCSILFATVFIKFAMGSHCFKFCQISLKYLKPIYGLFSSLDWQVSKPMK